MKTRVAKRSIAGVLITAMLVMMLLPMSVMADVTTTKVLKPGKWATKSEWYDSSWENHIRYYKISVKKAGRLNFTLAKDTSIYLYSSSPSKTSEGGSRDLSSSSSGKMVAVDKGTYYLYVNEGKCKYTFTASATPTNYCISKAKALKANKKVYNVFTPKTNFTRWFKITNPKKKKIVYWSNEPEDVIVLNSKFQPIPTIAYGFDTKYCTKKALPKGTYYLAVKGWTYEDYSWTDNKLGYVTSLRWK